MTQLAFDLAERGANLAAAKADRLHENWTAKALAAFKLYAASHQFFTTEDVVLANPNLPAPPDKRSWGSVTLKAQRLGYVRSTDKLARAKSPHAHKRPLLVLASNFFPATS
jgi:hypothetical protein